MNDLLKISLVTCLLAAVSFRGLGYGQNLVPNGSFEDYSQCPQYAAELYKATGWNQPTSGTPDYFNSCSNSEIADINVPLNMAGFQNPNTGNGYAGFAAVFSSLGEEENREYLQAKLSSPLISGETYYVSFFVSLSDSSIRATDDIGVFFSVNNISGSDWNNLEYLPQIENTSNSFVSEKVNWIKISGEFIAQGGEEYITIGNFKDNSNTTVIAVDGGMYFYAGYYFIDDICVSSNSSTCLVNVGLNALNKQHISIFPNPASNQVKITLKSNSEVRILNSNGMVIADKINVDEIDLDCSEWEQGVYFIQIKNDYEYFIEKLIIIHP